MKELPPNPVILSFSGIEGLSRKSLAFLFSAQKTPRYEIVDEHPDAIKIIDIDDQLGKAAWEDLQASGRGQPGTPVIIVGRESLDVANGISLQKPFFPRQLLAAVESLAAEIRKQMAPPAGDTGTPAGAVSAPSAARKTLSPGIASGTNKREALTHIGTTPDVDLDDPNAVAEVQYDPGQFLVQRMLELIGLAAMEKIYIHVGCCGVVFYIDPHQHCIRTLVKERNLRTFGALPLDYDAFVYHKEARLPKEIESLGFSFPNEDFVWRMILASSRGRLPKNTDLDQRYLLQPWPGLARLPLFPHVMQVSAAWAASPKSIREMAGELDIPQRYIFTFFAAANTMGYLQPAGATGDQTPQPTRKAKRASRGLLSRLLKTR